MYIQKCIIYGGLNSMKLNYFMDKNTDGADSLYSHKSVPNHMKSFTG